VGRTTIARRHCSTCSAIPGAPRGSAGAVCYACEGLATAQATADCVRDRRFPTGTMICDGLGRCEMYSFLLQDKFCCSRCRIDADCASGQACNERKSCEKTCVSYGGTCPVDFTCNASGFCRRILCKSDSDCSAFCVNGACYDTARGLRLHTLLTRALSRRRTQPLSDRSFRAYNT